MIALRPFRAWRPVPEKAGDVGSRSYVSYTPEQLAEKLAGDPDTFLHVIHPQESQGPETTRQQRFQHIRNAFRRFCERGTMVREVQPAIYVYEQHAHGNTSLGIIAGVSVQDHLEGRIKVHEQTLTAREQLFTEYLGATGINAEPVLLATPPGMPWEELLAPVTRDTPTYDMVTRDGVRHRIWASTALDLREALQEAFTRIPALYIADGHHRMASSARLANERGAQDVDPEAWCLAYIVPYDHLHIYNFDRAVKDLGGLSPEHLLERLARVGTLTPARSPRTAPGTIAVHSTKGWHHLRLPAVADDAAPWDRLDAARLSELVLGPLLGITDLRTDPRITFVPGTEPLSTLEAMVACGEAEVVFHLHPVDFADLRAVADAGGTMPPKSTYIEPKLRSGITVYSLEDV
jgi:uncharacterized protein (DUF1015 family)